MTTYISLKIPLLYLSSGPRVPTCRQAHDQISGARSNVQISCDTATKSSQHVLKHIRVRRINIFMTQTEQQASFWLEMIKKTPSSLRKAYGMTPSIPHELQARLTLHGFYAANAVRDF